MIMRLYLEPALVKLAVPALLNQELALVNLDLGPALVKLAVPALLNQELALVILVPTSLGGHLLLQVVVR